MWKLLKKPLNEYDGLRTEKPTCCKPNKDENIIVIGSPLVDLPASKGRPVDVAESARIAEHFRKEINRIYNN